MEQLVEKRMELGDFKAELNGCEVTIFTIVNDLVDVLYKTNRLVGKTDDFESNIEANILVTKNEYVKKEIQRIANGISQNIADLRGIAYDVVQESDRVVHDLHTKGGSD